MKKVFFLFTTFLASIQSSSAEGKKPSLAREEILKQASIELKAIEIKARIYEPQVFYVQDRSKIELEFPERKNRFSDRIEALILQNKLGE